MSLLDTLIAQAAEVRKEVQDAQAVADDAGRILDAALKRGGEINRKLYAEVDRRVQETEGAG